MLISDGNKVMTKMGYPLDLEKVCAAFNAMQSTLQAIADGEVMKGEFTHAETVHTYQQMARKALPE